MRIECLPGHQKQKIPVGYKYPISLETLRREFSDILPSSLCYVKFAYFENTADVLIIRAFWDEAIDLWSMDVIAVREEMVEIEHLLSSEGVDAVKDWLCKAHDFLHLHSEEWLYCSLTLRHLNGDLVYDGRQGERLGKRRPRRPSLPF